MQVVASYALALLQGEAHARSVWSGACEVQETCTQYTTWAAVDCLARHAVVGECETGEAHIQSAGNGHEQASCRVKRKTLWGPSGKN